MILTQTLNTSLPKGMPCDARAQKLKALQKKREAIAWQFCQLLWETLIFLCFLINITPHFPLYVYILKSSRKNPLIHLHSYDVCFLSIDVIKLNRWNTAVRNHKSLFTSCSVILFI